MARNGDMPHGVATAFAWGAAARKATKFAREIGSATTLEAPSIHDTRRAMLRAVHKSTAKVSMEPMSAEEE